MKKTILLAAIALFASVNASAQVYAGATVGTSNYDLDCSGVVDCKTTGTAFKALVGYQINPLFGLEASYFDLGNISGKESGVSIKGGATGIDFAGVLRMQLNQDISLFSRLGIANIEGKVNGTYQGNSATIKHSSTQPVYGFGATYSINKTLRARAEIEARRAKVAGNGDTISVNTYSIGLENSF